MSIQTNVFEEKDISNLSVSDGCWGVKPMPNGSRLDSLEDVKLWVAEHDGRIDAWWEAQHMWNHRMEERLDRINSRLSSIERRVIFVAGLMSAAGSLIGVLFSTKVLG